MSRPAPALCLGDARAAFRVLGPVERATRLAGQPRGEPDHRAKLRTTERSCKRFNRRKVRPMRRGERVVPNQFPQTVWSKVSKSPNWATKTIAPEFRSDRRY